MHANGLCDPGWNIKSLQRRYRIAKKHVIIPTPVALLIRSTGATVILRNKPRRAYISSHE